MQALEDSRLARSVLDHLIEGCQVISEDWRYLYVNEAVARQARRSVAELLGRTMMECFPGIDGTPMFDVLRRAMSERVVQRMENEFQHLDGSTGWFELRFVPVPAGVCILSRDVTDEKRAAAALLKDEDRLRQTQKMEAVGRLAGAVAHDFNNLLSVILSYASVAIDGLRASDPLRDDLEEIRKAAERAAKLTRQILSFSHQQVMAPQLVDLNAVIGGIESMLRRLGGDGVRLVVRPGGDPSIVRADPGQLEQVLVNLTTNARDAMPDGGELIMETSSVTFADDGASRYVGVTPGPYVMLAVSDTGTGMDAGTQARIFEPFFTTKPRGEGTGLGLATAFGIVRQCGGNIWVYSEVGRGTTFRIYLPSAAAADNAARAAPPTAGAGLRSGRGEMILVVEDTDPVRAVICEVLRRNGYQVIESRSAEEALGIARSLVDSIQLVLTDVVLPHMTGPALVDQLVALRPDLRVLYMSGYPQHAASSLRLEVVPEQFLQKPITPEVLISRVRHSLSR